MNDIEVLHDDEVLCIDHMQSFHDHADFNNLNVHVAKQSACRWENKIKCKTMREIAYKNHSIQYLVIVITRTETKHSCIWSVEND